MSGLSTASTDSTTLLSRLDELQKAVESAQGSSAAVGLAQSAYTAASEAVKILRELQAEVGAKGTASEQALSLLQELGEKLTSVSASVTVIPGKFGNDEDLMRQLKELAKKAQGVASEKGYQFDALYDIAQSQTTDVKSVRNRVEELKQLLELQRALLQRNLDQPVMKTWFEAQ